MPSHVLKASSFPGHSWMNSTLNKACVCMLYIIRGMSD